MDHPVLGPITRRMEYDARPVGRAPIRYINTHRPAARSNTVVLGGKTGFNNAARYCLVLAAEVGGRTLGMAFLGTEGELTRFGDVGRGSRTGWWPTGPERPRTQAPAGAGPRRRRQAPSAAPTAPARPGRRPRRRCRRCSPPARPRRISRCRRRGPAARRPPWIRARVRPPVAGARRPPSAACARIAAVTVSRRALFASGSVAARRASGRVHGPGVRLHSRHLLKWWCYDAARSAGSAGRFIRMAGRAGPTAKRATANGKTNRPDRTPRCPRSPRASYSLSFSRRTR